MKQIEQIIETPNEYHLTEAESKELTNLEVTIKRGLEVFWEVGEALFTIRDKRLYRSTHETFDAYCRDRWQMSKTQANRLIGAADVARDLTPIGVILPSNESVARPLVPLPTEQRQDVWHAVVESTADRKPTSADVIKAVKEIVPVEAIPSDVFGNDQDAQQGAISDSTPSRLEEVILEDGRKLFIRYRPGAKSVFNRTNEMVDWADWTWNPVTGCFHGCNYCYARDIANRFYDTKFEPTFHPDRLQAPRNTKVPSNVAHPRQRNVFVCSMADLFGKWVPQDWIMQVFDQVISNPQWNFLFLTKFPQRLQEICDELGGFPDNAFVGTTVDQQHRVKVAEKAFTNIQARIKWLSCEPMLEPLTFNSLDMFDWVVIGAQTKSTQAPEFQPNWDWVMYLHQQARDANCKIYLKENLNLLKECPW